MRTADFSPISAGRAARPRGNKETSVPCRVTQRQATEEPWGAAGTEEGPGGLCPVPTMLDAHHHQRAAANPPGPAGQERRYSILTISRSLLKTHGKDRQTTAFPAAGGCDLFPRTRHRLSTHRECRGVGFITLFSAVSRTAKPSCMSSWSGLPQTPAKSGGPNATACCVSGSNR